MKVAPFPFVRSDDVGLLARFDSTPRSIDAIQPFDGETGRILSRERDGYTIRAFWDVQEGVPNGMMNTAVGLERYEAERRGIAERNRDAVKLDHGALSVAYLLTQPGVDDLAQQFYANARAMRGLKRVAPFPFVSQELLGRIGDPFREALASLDYVDVLGVDTAAEIRECAFGNKRPEDVALVALGQRGKGYVRIDNFTGVPLEQAVPADREFMFRHCTRSLSMTLEKMSLSKEAEGACFNLWMISQHERPEAFYHGGFP